MVWIANRLRETPTRGRRRDAPWLPLYLSTLVALTLFPFAPIVCDWPGTKSAMAPFEIAANALLFVPLGLALRRRALPAVLGAAVLVSSGIEAAQLVLPRSPSAVDVAINTAGALFGRLLPVHERALARAVLALGIAGGPLLFAATLFAAAKNPGHDFASWEAFPLVVGGDPGGDGRFRGAVERVAIWDEAVPPRGGSGSGSAPAEPAPLLLLRSPPPGPLPARAAREVLEGLGAAGRMTVAADVLVSGVEDPAPAGIVSLAAGPDRVDFELGQVAANVVFRVRTPATGPAGDAPEARTRNAPLAPGRHALRGVYDGFRSLVYVDGVCLCEIQTALHASPFLVGWGLGTAVVLCPALLALTVSWAGTRWTRRPSLARLAAAGALAWVALWSLGTWDHVPHFTPAAAVLGLAAVLCARHLESRVRGA